MLVKNDWIEFFFYKFINVQYLLLKYHLPMLQSPVCSPTLYFHEGRGAQAHHGKSTIFSLSNFAKPRTVVWTPHGVSKSWWCWCWCRKIYLCVKPMIGYVNLISGFGSLLILSQTCPHWISEAIQSIC